MTTLHTSGALPTIREVLTPQDRALFVDFPYRLYKGNPYWIPPIKKAEAATFDPLRNPGFKVCKVKLWIVEKEGRVAGRIAALINEQETLSRGEVIARFGWIEFEDDPAVSRLLLETACEWGKAEGAKWIKGPVGFTNLDAAGITVEGFDELGTIFGPYNHPYYGPHLDQLGFEKLDDFLENIIEEVPKELPPKLKRLEPIIEQKFGARQVFIKSHKEMNEAIWKFFHLLSETYRELPTFVPLTDEQAAWYINDFIPLMKPEYLAILQDKQGEMIGFGLIIPSYAEAFVKAKGKLFPFGLLHLLWAKKYHRAVNLIMIGFVEKWRNKGLNAILFANYIPVVAKQKVNRVFLNPQLESNYAPFAIFRDYNPRQFRRRRLYRKDL